MLKTCGSGLVAGFQMAKQGLGLFDHILHLIIFPSPGKFFLNPLTDISDQLPRGLGKAAFPARATHFSKNRRACSGAKE